MAKSSSNIKKSFLWGTFGQVMQAVLQVLSVPLLIKQYGKSEYGLIVLAMSVNAYMTLLDMGINTGAIKFFSEWINQKDYDKLDAVARTSISFYGIIGCINAIALLVFAFFGFSWFHLDPGQHAEFQTLFVILALFSIFNWGTQVFNQLLTANDQLYLIKQINILRIVLSFAIIFFVKAFNMSLVQYFFWYTLINSILVLPFYFASKKAGLIRSFIPGLDWKRFGIIFKYSMAIIAMGVFQMSASKLRPVVLSIFSTSGSGILTEYRVMDTITTFIISIGGLFVALFLPKTSKLLQDGDKTLVREFIYRSTKITTLIVLFLSVPIILCSNEVLTIYVGSKYSNLSIWLNIWVVSIIISLHNSPVASMVMATGKTRMLVYSSGLAFFISVVINAVLCKYLGVGSAVIGFCAYVVIQMCFYYFYFNIKVLDLDSAKVFFAFFKPTALAFVSLLIVLYTPIYFKNNFARIFIKTGLWSVLYLAMLEFSKVFKLKEILALAKFKTAKS